MAAAHVDLNDEIDRLSTELQAVEAELLTHHAFTSQVDRSPRRTPPSLLPYGQPWPREMPEPPRHRVDTHDGSVARAPRRKEIEARRYSGKEPVAEYLLQFDLTARRNGWTDSEKATSLLCALDGPARSLLAEIDDIDTVSYAAVKNLLTKRFGPITLPDVHEQALQDLKLARGQPIREITPEVSRLVKLAYPEFDLAARERLAIKALINATSDKETIFYIKEKDPRSLEEVCALYERFKVLTGHPPTHRPATVKGIKPDGAAATPPTDATVTALLKQAEAHNKQLADLTEAVGRLLQQSCQPAPPAPTAPVIPVAGPHVTRPSVAPPPQQPQLAPSQPRYAAATPNTAPPPQQQYYRPRQRAPAPLMDPRPPPSQGQTAAPRQPCPRCGQPGHWARDCPAPADSQTPPGVCYLCGQPGHFRRNCPAHLN